MDTAPGPQSSTETTPCPVLDSAVAALLRAYPPLLDVHHIDARQRHALEMAAARHVRRVGV